METIDKKMNEPTKKNMGFVYGAIGFVVAIILVVVLVSCVVVPSLNKNLKKMGIQSFNEFVVFYQEVNKYIDDSSIIKNAFSAEDFKSAYNKFMNVDAEEDPEDDAEKIDIFKEKYGDISNEKVKNLNFTNGYGEINLTDKELCSLISSAFKDKNFVDDLNISLIDQYGVDIEFKEITLKIKTDETLGVLSGVYQINTVCRITLDKITKQLTWPYNGMMPESVYVSTNMTVRVDSDNFTYTMLNHGININNMSENSHNVVINIINAQVQNEEDYVTLESLSKTLNTNIYEGFVKFAEKISGNFTIKLQDKDEQIVPYFCIEYND